MPSLSDLVLLAVGVLIVAMDTGRIVVRKRADSCWHCCKPIEQDFLTLIAGPRETQIRKNEMILAYFWLMYSSLAHKYADHIRLRGN